MTNLTPPPINTVIANATGSTTPAYQAWFNSVYNSLISLSGGNAQANRVTTNSPTIVQNINVTGSGSGTRYVNVATTGANLSGAVYSNGPSNTSIGSKLYFAAGVPTIDGYVPTTVAASQTLPLLPGSRILVKDQTSGINNGIYVLQANLTTLVRAVDYDNSSTGVVNIGSEIYVQSGNYNAGTAWFQTSFNGLAASITPTSALNFQFVIPNYTPVWLAPCTAATTAVLSDLLGANGTYNNGNNGVGATLTFTSTLAVAPIDFAILAKGSRLLVQNQTLPSQNGIYVVQQVNPAILIRSLDFNGSYTGPIYDGASSYIESGALNAGIIFTQVAFNSPTSIVGTNSIQFNPLTVPLVFSGVSFPSTGGILGQLAAYGGPSIYQLALFQGTSWAHVSAAPAGAAGGGLTGTYPNPTVASVPASALPNPTASTLGGIESYAAVSHQWINTISTSGVPSSTQPAVADLSDTKTGSGNIVLATSPTLVTPLLGTPTSGNLANCTGYGGTASGIAAGNANIPACSAIPAGATTLAANGYTKITLLGTPNFDIGSYMDHTTNSRYLPLKAGIYNVTMVAYLPSAALLTPYTVALYKNGTIYEQGAFGTTTVAGDMTVIGTFMVSLNGSTDYIEMFGYNGHATNTTATYGGAGIGTYVYMNIQYVGPTS